MKKVLVGTVALLSLAGVSGQVSAAETSTVGAKSSLQAQAETQVAAVSSQKGVAKSETRPSLSIGSNSSYVDDLQQILKDLKYDTSVDGIFGPKTQAVVKQVQADHNLSQDGIVGPLTWAALDQNKVERQQFTVDDAIAIGQKKLGKNIVFGGDGRLVKDNKKQSYYQLKAANKDWIDEGGSGTIGWFHIYKDGRVVEE
ncbi:peptidoglycan-binding protein [Bacillus capparidis]|uniref:Peptidoglycan hydrolase-like protein with peptidoglycan-binding domain n=1 Tax=Bacillus capparidis TaxID=1840411 RepID=A0ABS4CYX8_9BACI|nr:peptidoglycan-binding domain-containing protein [Bacillus capparidis]MBP1082555.1 peptidoglycan hydrolase-like protein with peptidoglycan-binding domain [Bacillus capparidis]MED1097215.1 peptidoglycan-binding domain-containing protein [Bacillus capparidis]